MLGEGKTLMDRQQLLEIMEAREEVDDASGKDELQVAIPLFDMSLKRFSGNLGSNRNTVRLTN